MPGPYVGRVARLAIGGAAVAYGKNISVKLTAEAVKDYSMDSAAPAMLASGKQTYTFSIERLYVDETYLSALLAGTPLTVAFWASGSAAGTEVTLTGAIITSAEHSAGESGGVLEKVSGEALVATVT